MTPSVLIVEDEQLVARELQLRLEDLKYRVSGVAASADTAIEMVASRMPDLVLMDIQIHGARDGIETAELMLRRFDLPIVFLTAHGDQATVDRAKRIGPVGYLLKPVQQSALAVAIEVGLYKHRMVQQLRDRERWFSTTLRSIGDAVISTDAVGAVTFMNPVAEQLTGWRLESARGVAVSDVFRLGDGESPIARAVASGQVVHVSGRLTTRLGPARDIADSAAPIVDDAGQVLGGVLVFRDVTEQRVLERQLAATERLASLGTLAAGVAHEINNPLTWVMANLETVIDGLAAGPPTREAAAEAVTNLRDALDGARRIRRIVGDLSVFSRPRAELAVADVHDAVRQAIASVGATPVAVTTDLAGVPRVAIGDSRLVQVLVNLVVNAAHAIATAPAARAHVLHITVAPFGDRVRIAVRDSGIGMSPEVRARVFEPFYTTKRQGEGSGLGLAVCHGIVNAAGGSIVVASTPGEGTTFTIELPIAAEVAPPPAPVEVAVPVRRRILAIDDEAIMRRMIARILRDHDIVVTDAPDALARLVRGERYDAILCDLMMPELDGIDVYERILALDPAQARRVAFVTGGAFSVRTAEFLASTPNRVLPKPFSPADLRTLVEHLTAP